MSSQISSKSTMLRETSDATATLVHELRNPLAAVKALVQLLRAGATDPRTERRLDVVHAEVLHMEAILRDHLERGAVHDMQPVDLSALVNDVLAVLEARAASSGVTLASHAIPTTIAGDASHLRSALLNLVGNAIEATPAGGRVDVTVEQRHDRVHVEIRDTGKGIAAEDLARLGTPFFTLRQQGTGLGVLLARSVVVDHGGSLEYDSELGCGTTARVTLPARPEVETSTPPAWPRWCGGARGR